MIYQRPPLRPRQVLTFDGQPIGTVEAGVARHLQAVGLLAADGAGWRVAAPFDTLAQALSEAGWLGAWRHELLPVLTDSGERVGLIERAAVRALGLTTAAVHLTAQAPDGRTWVQQRAFNKPNDPGLWDTLMGGMVSAADTLAQALARETWEEAGLRLSQFQGLTHAGHVLIRRPSGGADLVGYTVERIDWFSATLPDGVWPENQDGEVERFDQVDAAHLRSAIAAGHYTLEAALILAPDLVSERMSDRSPEAARGA